MEPNGLQRNRGPSAVKRHQVPVHATIRRDLENAVLREASRSRRPRGLCDSVRVKRPGNSAEVEGGAAVARGCGRWGRQTTGGRGQVLDLGAVVVGRHDCAGAHS